MKGSLALVLHAHLPFVRHPEHKQSLEENWLFEAITESYIPLLQVLDRWDAEALPGTLTFSITPTLGAMLRDSLLQARYKNYLDDRIKLAKSETFRTHWQPPVNQLGEFYLDRFRGIRSWLDRHPNGVLGAFRYFYESGRVEIVASAATHAVLPLLRTHPRSLRAQVAIGCDAFEAMFGQRPKGFWLPECAWAAELDDVLANAGIQWFITESHGVINADPQPRYGLFAPVITPQGLAAFGRDAVSARQVWSRDEGYPGDPWYRDFYRDIGFDLDIEYLQEFLPVQGRRTFTGIKYHRITGKTAAKAVYSREAALDRVREHARHFVTGRMQHLEKLQPLFQHGVLVCPFDAELFGHWWFEGPEFIDALAREAHSAGLQLVTPGGYLQPRAGHQQAVPADSSWGEQGYWGVWLNEKNHWIAARLAVAQDRMEALASKAAGLDPVSLRALKQAGRELLLAQASDWPFIIRTGTSPGYATQRVKAHLLRFWKLCDEIEAGRVDAASLDQIESVDNIFPELDYRCWT